MLKDHRRDRQLSLGQLPESSSPWFESTEQLEQAFDRMSIQADQVQRALDALLELNPNQRLAVGLHYLHGLSYSEIGLVLGVHKSNAYRYARRGLAKMRRILSEPEAPST